MRHLQTCRTYNKYFELLGNNKTPIDCCNRWNRVVNPLKRKCDWDLDEDSMLLYLVSQYGDEDWKRISTEIGTRSDFQCQIHYQFIKHHECPKEKPPGW